MDSFDINIDGMDISLPPNLNYWFLHGFVVGKQPLKLSRNIYSCTLRALAIYEQTLTLREVDFLLNGGKMRHLLMLDMNIHDDNGKLVTSDKILAKTPKIIKFQFGCENESYNLETFENLRALNFRNKIDVFNLHIHALTPDADPLILCDFIKKNFCAHLRSTFHFCFKMENAGAHQLRFQTVFKKVFLLSNPEIMWGLRICISKF